MGTKTRLTTATVVALTAVLLQACVGGVQPSPPSSPPPTTPPSSPATSPTPNSSATPTPSPTAASTWSAEQTAAIDAVHGYYSVTSKIGADPSGYTDAEITDLIKQYAGGDMIDSNVGYYSSLRDKRYHEVGQAKLLSTDATEVVDNHNDRGLEVHVTLCWDQTQIAVVDASGTKVTEDGFQIPPYNLRQFSVRMPAESDTWLVFGAQTVEGACG